MIKNAGLNLATQNGRVHIEGKTKSQTNTKQQRYDGTKPKYVQGEHYTSEFNKGGGKNKISLPNDAEDVYDNAVPADATNPRTWFGVNKEGNVYRYSADKNGYAHFSGRSDSGDGIGNYTNYAKERLKQINPNVKFFK